MSKEAMKQALEAYCKTLHPLWNTGISRAEAEGFFNAGFKAAEALAKQEHGEPVAWRAPNWGHSADEYVYRDFDDPVIGADGKPSPNNEPLYTTPQPKQEQDEPKTDTEQINRGCWYKTDLTTPQQRKPLTDEQLKNHYQNNEWLDGVRFAEQFHGIKE